MNSIRLATIEDVNRIAEIVVFNYRLNFYPIFQDAEFYFKELQVSKLMDAYKDLLSNLYVFDDGVVKGFIQIENKEVKKLFVEPVLQGQSIGSELLKYAIDEFDVNYLWALEKNEKAIRFYERHGFHITDEKKLEEGTSEYLVLLKR